MNLNLLLRDNFLKLDEPDRKRLTTIVSWLENLPSLVETEMQDLKIFPKGSNDLVTSVDLAVEKSFLSAVGELFIDDTILSEESGWRKGSNDYLHVLDPIDLTRNVPRNLPFLCLYTFRKKDQPLITAIMGFREFYLYLGLFDGTLIYANSNNIEKFELKPQTRESLRYAWTHNFKLMDHNLPDKDRGLGSTRADYYSEVLTGQIDCYLATLDDTGIQWGFYAWDFLPYLDLIQLSGRVEIIYSPSQEIFIFENGRLGCGGDYLKSILCVNKSKKEDALLVAKKWLSS